MLAQCWSTVYDTRPAIRQRFNISWSFLYWYVVSDTTKAKYMYPLLVSLGFDHNTSWCPLVYHKKYNPWFHRQKWKLALFCTNEILFRTNKIIFPTNEIISYKRNNISYKRNIILYKRNNVSYKRNSISYKRNNISYKRNNISYNTKYYFVQTK